MWYNLYIIIRPHEHIHGLIPPHSSFPTDYRLSEYAAKHIFHLMLAPNSLCQSSKYWTKLNDFVSWWFMFHQAPWEVAGHQGVCVQSLYPGSKQREDILRWSFENHDISAGFVHSPARSAETPEVLLTRGGRRRFFSAGFCIKFWIAAVCLCVVNQTNNMTEAEYKGILPDF